MGKGKGVARWVGLRPREGRGQAFGPKMERGKVFPFSFVCFLFVSLFFKVFSKQFQNNSKIF